MNQLLKTQTQQKLSVTLGMVELHVQHVQIMKEFYTQVLGLDIHAESKDSITLSKQGKPIFMLHHSHDRTKAPSTHAGLYHFAIVFASQAELAQTIYKVLKFTPHLFSGSADHLVSEAFYFNDPEGNGIELYFDRDRSSWQWENNSIKMASIYIDPIEYIREHSTKPSTGSVTMGHVHLKVGDISKAKQFYVDILGFETTAELPGALFVATDRYHHHIGMNTWESLGAGERKEFLGLKTIHMIVADQSHLVVIKTRLSQHKIGFIESASSITVHDPWKNELIMEAKP